eukprot:11167084-Ditylum_brightwellii.AAC.2
MEQTRPFGPCVKSVTGEALFGGLVSAPVDEKEFTEHASVRANEVDKCFAPQFPGAAIRIGCPTP